MKSVVLAGVTKTLSRVETPVAVQFATTVVEATALGKSTAHVPKRSWVIPEPTAPMRAPALDVVVPVTPSSVVGDVVPTPSHPAVVTVVVPVPPN